MAGVEQEVVVSSPEAEMAAPADLQASGLEAVDSLQQHEEPAPASDGGEAAGIIGATPKKRRRSTTTAGSVSNAPQNVALTVAIGMPENRAKVDLEVCLLELGEMKDVGAGGGGKGKGPRRVLTVVVADREMIAQIGLWTPVAEKAENTIAQAFENVSGEGYYPKLKFSNLERVEVARNPCLVVKFQSTRGTTVRAMSPEQLAIIPSPMLTVNKFEGLNRAGKNANLVGVLSAVGELTHSQAGHPMRACVMNGADKCALRVMLHGAWAMDDDVRVGQKVALFYAVSQAGIRGAYGYYWIYDDSYVLMLGDTTVEQATKVLEIPTQDEDE